MIRIPLTKGQFAIVDDEDADLAQFKWQAIYKPEYSGGGKFIAKRTVVSNGKKRHERLHRVILSRMLNRPLLPSEEVDHIHGNPLDNRRSELRLATSRQNSTNKQKTSSNKSGYKGVHWESSKNKWRAQIRIDGKRQFLGYFDDPQEAHEAYCRAGIPAHGEFFNPG